MCGRRTSSERQSWWLYACREDHHGVACSYLRTVYSLLRNCLNSASAFRHIIFNMAKLHIFLCCISAVCSVSTELIWNFDLSAITLSYWLDWSGLDGDQLSFRRSELDMIRMFQSTHLHHHQCRIPLDNFHLHQRWHSYIRRCHRIAITMRWFHEWVPLVRSWIRFHISIDIDPAPGSV